MYEGSSRTAAPSHTDQGPDTQPGEWRVRAHRRTDGPSVCPWSVGLRDHGRGLAMLMNIAELPKPFGEFDHSIGSLSILYTCIIFDMHIKLPGKP